MRMSSWICGKTRRERIGNENICEIIGLALIGDGLKESRLRSLGHRAGRGTVVGR